MLQYYNTYLGYTFNIQDYTCNKCGITYMYRGSFQRHSKFKCGITPKFGCSLCEKVFFQKSNLNRHVFVMHRSTIEELINNSLVIVY